MFGALAVAAALAAVPATAQASPDSLRAAYRARVTPRLTPPDSEAARYGAMAVAALRDAGAAMSKAQYLLLVDRNPRVQAVFSYWVAANAEAAQLIGASPASTGSPRGFDHFETPLGVFAHTPDNPDYRAEGTYNANGIRGYGVEGMRVFDLGWQQARRLWGQGGIGTMRLLMHATDPARLEPRLGTVQSKGCIRIAGSLNKLIDEYGLLDADYLALQADGVPQWVLPARQQPEPDAGRYIVVVDSQASRRPDWARPTRAKAPTAPSRDRKSP